MTDQQRLFGTAGIRGVTNSEITPELALRLARAYGEWLHRHGRKYGSLGIGHDTRWGADMLSRAAASGFASAGFNVEFYGCVTTGVFSVNVARRQQDGGFLVTGSHMAPDRIGLLLVEGDGAICPFQVTDAVEELLKSNSRREVAPADIGRVEQASGSYECFISECEQAIDAPLCRAQKFRVVVDPANGAASHIAAKFFAWLGCRAEHIHSEPGPVPARPSEPRAATVTAAMDAVRQKGVDLGICFDVDADRVLFIDGAGRPVSEDTVGAIFARHVLKAGDICAVPVNSSGLIESVCHEIGARIEYCGIGQPQEVRAIKEYGASFCYEESGKYYFPPRFLWADGLVSAARLMEIMSREQKSLAELTAEFPSYYQVKKNVTVDDRSKVVKAMEEVAHRLKTRLTEGRVRDVTIDGFKRIFADHAWLLFRQSGTEPLIRVYSDAPARERAEELATVGEALLRECL